MKKNQKILFVGIISIIIFFLILLFSSPSPDNSPAQKWSDLSLNPDDRILILAPHPDDEVIGCGGVIQKAKEMNLPVHIAFLTNGDFNEWSFMLYRERPVIFSGDVLKMGEVRHDEAVSAAKTLGLSSNDLTFLGYPDFGTLKIWYKFWNDSPPYTGILTRVTEVSYSNALRPGAPYRGEEIVKDVKAVIQNFNPTKIFVSHPADHHPDHQAFFLFTTVALWELKKDIKVHPYLVHYNKWPLPKKYLPPKALFPPETLKHNIPWEILPLDKDEVNIKTDALKEHKSQYMASTKYLLSFIRANELFGYIPTIRLKEELSEGLLDTNFNKRQIKIPEELFDEEKAVFVGLVKQFVRYEDDKLDILLTCSKPLAKTVELSLYIFGYRNDTEFKVMPKIHIKFGAFSYSVYDGNKQLDKNIIYVSRTSRQISISIPFSIINNPEKILISSRTYISEVPLDWTPWRIIELDQQ